jgi:hypothetical protein
MLVPFLPIRCIPQGSVPRRGDPSRPRRISDHGAPRASLVVDGERVLSSNVLSGAGRHERRAGDTRWPREIKPRQGAVMRDDAVLAQAARSFGEPLVFFSDDASDAFMQLYTHPSEHWVMCLLNLDPSGHLQCVEEGVLGYGGAPSSNIFQRLPWTFGHVVVDAFEAGEAALLAQRAARGELSADAAAYVATRATISVVTGANELRFCTHWPYTDDFRFGTFGAARTIRLLSCWGRAVGAFKLQTCSAGKRQLGLQNSFLGVIASAPGVSVIAPAKHARAVAGLRSVVDGPALDFQEYRSLVMFLSSLLDVVHETREIMHGLYIGPADGISALVTSCMPPISRAPRPGGGFSFSAPAQALPGTPHT